MPRITANYITTAPTKIRSTRTFNAGEKRINKKETPGEKSSTNYSWADLSESLAKYAEYLEFMLTTATTANQLK